MSTNDINATLEIRGDAQGGSEPWGKNASLTLDANGYHDPEGVGAGGVDPAYIAASAAAALLLEEFDRAELVALLDRIAALRDVLKT
jgi:hypothetical protein